MCLQPDEPTDHGLWAAWVLLTPMYIRQNKPGVVIAGFLFENLSSVLLLDWQTG